MNSAANEIAKEIVRALRAAHLDQANAVEVINGAVADMQAAIVRAGGTGSADEVAAALRAAHTLVLAYGRLVVKHARQMNDQWRVLRSDSPATYEQIIETIQRMLIN